jgi:hypothetical protein
MLVSVIVLVRLVLLLFVACIFTAEAAAQVTRPTPVPRVVRRPPPPPRPWFISVGANYPARVPRFDNTVSVTEFREQGSRTVTYSAPNRPGLDLDAGFQVIPRLFFGAGVSLSSGSGAGTIAAEIPHPFFFDQKRPLSAPVGGLERKEVGVHIQAATTVSISRRLRLLLAAGPSIFVVRHGLVTGVSYQQEYPYDEVAFTGAATESQVKTGFGFHAQANVITMLSRRLGADLLIRYSNASVDFRASDESTFSAPLGGLQAGVGIRAMF